MKKSEFLICTALAVAPMAVDAETCNPITCTADIVNVFTASNCARTNTACYQGVGSRTKIKITSCTTCQPGYTTNSPSSIGPSCLGSLYTTCVCTCNNCVSDSDWSAGNTGYQKKVNRYCTCASGSPVCNATTSYRCAIGYYGHSSDGISGCAPCPSSGGPATTSTPGTTAITSCYQFPGPGYSDTSGTFMVTDKCYYIN